ncbi:F0F1 ATP synthase subunit A [Parabacteroides sp. OttesenSCG-928-G07]|nr:F0F1 ATP synthase subunit A [Parabacteroides sp. OttesenSCG-928-G21]MDL2277977.1 F0F1 ATP synthase subunit A [Parabacteroides sp. OttesenSCG-928-G07]
MILKNNILRLGILLLVVVLFTPSARAAEDFNVKETVFEHIGDAYSWHIATIADTEISIHLPVIVKGKDSGWQVFSSSRLEQGAEYKGYRIAQEGDYKGKIVERNHTGLETRPVIDISITKNVLGLWINCIVLLLIILPVARWYKQHTFEPPKGFRGAVETLMLDVQDELIKPCIGDDYKRYTPFLLTAFFFIFVNNLMGLIPFFPGGTNITGNITITLFLAVCTFLIVNISGTKEYWKEIFWPEVPSWLKVPVPFMPVIELFGVFTKPFALMIRLFANIMAGHSVIISLVCVIFITVSMGVGINIGMSAVSVVFTIFMYFIELLVAYIQAYVFTLLSAVFIGLAKVKHD